MEAKCAFLLITISIAMQQEARVLKVGLEKVLSDDFDAF